MTITFTGKHITWFLPKPYKWVDSKGYQWYDRGAFNNGEGPNASGLPFETPGFAFHNENHTLGGWWQIDIPDIKKRIITRQTDIGPRKPVIDLNAMLAFELFGTEMKADANDSHQWTITYLGKQLPNNVKEGITDLD